MPSSFAVVRKFISVVLILTLLISPEFSYAQSMFVSTLPEPGKMVGVSPAFTPVLVKGLVIHPDQPLNFDFIVDSGNASVEQAAIKEQSEKMVRYFLAALTVPEESLWVNLSPYEKDRIIDDGLGQTVLGRDMLAQDYVLKQLTASLIYPEDGLGKAFWARIYKEADEKFGTTDIPVDTFNKVWITPEKAEVFEKGNAVYVTQAKLKVMLDSDYTAMRHSERSEESQGLLVGVKDTTDQIIQRSFVAKDAPQDDGRVKAIIREVILPAIEKEVNEGKNFATLRQVYYAAILAKWYRELVQDTLMAQGYVGTNKISGVTTDEKALKEQIYQRYIAAYKQGVFNYIKEEPNAATGESTPKKYFSGGLSKFGLQDVSLEKTKDASMLSSIGKLLKAVFKFKPNRSHGEIESDPVVTHIGVSYYDRDPAPFREGYYDGEIIGNWKWAAGETRMLTGADSYDVGQGPENSFFGREDEYKIPGQWRAIDSSALSDNVDPAMISEVMQWVASNPGWTVAGVVTSLAAAVGLARVWWSKNTVAGNIRRLNSGKTRSNAIEFFVAHEERGGRDALIRLWQKSKAEDLARALYKLGWAPQDLNEKITFYTKAELWDELAKMGDVVVKKWVIELAEAEQAENYEKYNQISYFFHYLGDPRGSDYYKYHPARTHTEYWYADNYGYDDTGNSGGTGPGMSGSDEVTDVEAYWEKLKRSDAAANGGIDIKNIDVNKTGNARIQFDNDVLQKVFSGGFEGFTPVFIQMMPLESPLVAMGI